jgi:hypothetical protein
MTWVAELCPDGGVTDQVFFKTEKEAETFCVYKNPSNTNGIGMSSLWYCYEYEEPVIISIDKAITLYPNKVFRNF